MGCFDDAKDDGKPIDLGGAITPKPGAGGGTGGGTGGFGNMRYALGSLFRARLFQDSSLQAHAEKPDPLFVGQSKGKRTPLGVKRGRAA